MKRDNSEYTSQKHTFAKSLSAIMSDDEKCYYLRLIEYFNNCLEVETDPQKATRYREVVKKLNDTQTMTDVDIALVFGVSSTTVNRWRSYSKPILPPLDVPVKLSEIFGVTTDYILGRAELPDEKAQADYQPFSDMGFDSLAYKNLIRLKEENPSFYSQAISTLNLILTTTETLYNGRPIDPADVTEDMQLSFSLSILRCIAEYLDAPMEKYLIAPMAQIQSLMDKALVDCNNTDKQAELTEMILTKFDMPSPDILEAYKLSNLTQRLKEIKTNRLIEYGKTIGIDWPNKTVPT